MNNLNIEFENRDTKSTSRNLNNLYSASEDCAIAKMESAALVEQLKRKSSLSKQIMNWLKIKF